MRFLDLEDKGELRVQGTRTAAVIVNDQPVALPVIELAGTLQSWNRGTRAEMQGSALVLDDERFPLLIDVRSRDAGYEFRVQYAKITYPAVDGRGALEARAPGQQQSRRLRHLF